MEMGTLERRLGLNDSIWVGPDPTELMSLSGEGGAERKGHSKKRAIYKPRGPQKKINLPILRSWPFSLENYQKMFAVVLPVF